MLLGLDLQEAGLITMSESPFLPMSLEEEMAHIETLVIFDMFGCEGLEDA